VVHGSTTTVLEVDLTDVGLMFNITKHLHLAF